MVGGDLYRQINTTSAMRAPCQYNRHSWYNFGCHIINIIITRVIGITCANGATKCKQLFLIYYYHNCIIIFT